MRTPAQLAQIPKFVKAGSGATRGKKLERLANENNPAWKGDDVGYHGIHKWVARHFGKPMQCEKCGTTSYHRYEWANISKTYSRVRSDWIRLCVSCHRKMDSPLSKSNDNPPDLGIEISEEVGVEENIGG